MAKVGFEMYCQMLEDAVNKLKGKQKVEEPLEVTLEFPLSSYIPDNIMSDTLKVSFYRKISNCKALKDVDTIQEELEDRFGNLTLPIRNLLEIARIKVLAQQVKLKWIKTKSVGYLSSKYGFDIHMKFYNSSDITGKELLYLKTKHKKCAVFYCQWPVAYY